MKKSTQHVVPAPKGGWNVRKGGSDRATKHFDNKKDAIDWARQVSKNQKSVNWSNKTGHKNSND